MEKLSGRDELEGATLRVCMLYLEGQLHADERGWVEAVGDS